MTKPDIVLCSPVRTPIGTYGGALKDIPASQLGAVASLSERQPNSVLTSW